MYRDILYFLVQNAVHFKGFKGSISLWNLIIYYQIVVYADHYSHLSKVFAKIIEQMEHNNEVVAGFCQQTRVSHGLLFCLK